MALTAFQRTLCRLIAQQRRDSGESYIAGGVALNDATGTDRLSRDIDLFHDTITAVATSWDIDRKTLERAGYRVHVQREREGFVEAIVHRASDSSLLQWAADSAFRFFPLVEHPDFGLTLHPFDLATNKVLALVGRLEVRDWVDVIGCHDRIQKLGYLVWAASGKDAGWSPAGILEQAGRSARYTTSEIAALDFAGPSPDAGALARRWRDLLIEARAIIARLPPAESGKCVLNEVGELLAADAAALQAAIESSRIRFHAGSIRGALPQPR
jgi:hypothetical protein